MARMAKNFKQAGKFASDDCEKAIRAAAIELFGEIVKRTPVGNPSLWQSPPPSGYVGGRLRGNWQANIGTPKTDELNTIDANGAKTVGEATREINKFNLNEKDIYLTNNLPYAERVEYGWSAQRPQGMMRTTVMQFKPIIDKIAKRFNK